MNTIVRWINFDYSDRLVFFSKIEASAISGGMKVMTSWTTEECDAGHFILNFTTDITGLSDKLKCYSEIDGIETLIAIIELSEDIERSYFYSLRIAYPSSNSASIPDIRLKSVDTTADYESDQLFVFDTHRHSYTEEKIGDLIDPYSIKNLFLGDIDGNHNNILKSVAGAMLTSGDTDNDLELMDDYYEFIGD